MFVPVIGLVGGVGCGKSALADWLGARQGFIVIDGDIAGHQTLRDQSIREQIRNRFGDSVFNSAGDIHRSALGAVVFGPSAEKRTARADLERLVHPEIRKRLVEQIARARASRGVAAIILDAAVLFEAGWDDLCDAVVFIDVPESVRLQWVQETRGWEQADLRLRESSQQSLELKRNQADYIVSNTGTLADAGSQIEQIVVDLQT